MFKLTQEMVWPMMLFFLIGIGSGAFVGIAAWLFGAKCKRKKYRWSDIFLAITLHPFIDEIIFRGPVYLLRGTFLACWAVLIVWGGIIVGLIHGLHGIVVEEDYKYINKGGVICNILLATIYGIILGIIVRETHSLVSAMIIHALFNVWGFILIGVKRSLQRV